MNDALVSIIIPCYNVKKYLKDAVESAEHQTYSNIEIILVDDGSTDGTFELCDLFVNKYNNVQVIHKKNGGLSSARNAGMVEAKGEYIYFLDSDDFIKDNMVECLVQKMKENETDVIFFGSYQVDEEKNIIGSIKKNTESEQKVFRGAEAYSLYWKKGVYEACVPYYFYRKKFLMEHELSFIDGIIHEDEIFSFEVYHYAKRILLDGTQFYFRRVRIGSIMTSLDNQKHKFDSTVQITDMVVRHSYLKQFSKEEYKNISIFLYRIQNLMCSRFYEVPLYLRKSWGKKYRISLKKYITFAILYRQYTNLYTSIERYILSIYATHLKKEC